MKSNDAHDDDFGVGRIRAVASSRSGIGRALPVSDGPGMQTRAEGSSACGPDALPLREPTRQPDVGRHGADLQEECADGEAQQATWAERLSAPARECWSFGPD